MKLNSYRAAQAKEMPGALECTPGTFFCMKWPIIRGYP
jgi:hypothetical protein